MPSETVRRRTNQDALLNLEAQSKFNKHLKLVSEEEISDRKRRSAGTRLSVDSVPGLLQDRKSQKRNFSYSEPLQV